MRKKIFFMIIVALSSHLVLFAYNNNAQKIYPVDSELYEAITHLYFLDGRTMPSNTAPWSADELHKMLEALNYKTMSKVEKDIYTYVKAELNLKPEETEKEKFDRLFMEKQKEIIERQEYTKNIIDPFGIIDYKIVPKEEEKPKAKLFQFGLTATLEFYLHTNLDPQFIGRENWNYYFMKHKPFLAGTFEVWPADSFYTFFEVPLGNYKFHTRTSTFGDGYWMTNIPLLQNPLKPSIEDLDLNAPYRAFIAAGGSHWSMQIGRDRMSWGPGVVSNFVVGNNLEYHNLLRFTTYHSAFKYTFAISFFPHPKLYARGEEGEEGSQKPMWGFSENGQDSLLDGIYMFMAHRFEWRFWKDRFKIALTESIMYQSETNFIDLQILSPVMFFHDYYIRANANSLLAFEIEYTPIKNLNIYYQMVVDEIALGGENKPGTSPKARPNAFGYMLGSKYDHVIGDGVLSSSIEWALTDPYLYLRNNGGAGDQKRGEYGINYVVAIRQLTPMTTFYNGDRAATIFYDEQFLGYRYGGDAITLNLNCSYKVYNKWNAGVNLFYMAHGTNDKWTLWKMVTPSDQIQTPTSKPGSPNNQRGDVSYKNAVAHYFVIGFNGGYNILRDLKVYGQLDFVNIWNAGNIKGIYKFDVELTTGITYSI